MTRFPWLDVEKGDTLGRVVLVVCGPRDSSHLMHACPGAAEDQPCINPLWPAVLLRRGPVAVRCVCRFA